MLLSVPEREDLEWKAVGQRKNCPTGKSAFGALFQAGEDIIEQDVVLVSMFFHQLAQSFLVGRAQITGRLNQLHHLGGNLVE